MSRVSKLILLIAVITGKVSDATGSAVPSAIITLTNISNNAVRTTTTTDTGDYSFPSVPPGKYNIKTEHPGFKTASTNNIEIQIQQSVRLDFALEVGQVTESVEVSASAVLLQAENSTVGTVIENKRINELPLNGRQYLNLVALSPNTNTLSPSSGQAGSREGGDRASQSISAARASASCTTTSPSTASITPTRTSTPTSFSPPSMPFRSSRFRRGSIPPSSATKPRRSTC